MKCSMGRAWWGLCCDGIEVILVSATCYAVTAMVVLLCG